MSERAAISAVIPAYNSATYLPDAIASVRAQTVAVREIIVVDDGSIDNTAEVVAALGQDIRYIRQENAGPSAARNTGIAAAKGDFIAFLDADDQWTPGKTAEQLAVFTQHPDLVLVASDMAETDTEGRKIVVLSVLARHHLLAGFQRLDGRPLPDALAALLRKNFIPTGTVLVRRRVFEEVGVFNPAIRYGEDLELWSRVAARFPMTCLPHVHMLRRQHGENATQATAVMLEDMVKVAKTLRENIGPDLKVQGVDADALVSKSLFELAYFNFCAEDLKIAKELFFKSFKEKKNLKSVIYWASCHMPLAFVNQVRLLKQKLS